MSTTGLPEAPEDVEENNKQSSVERSVKRTRKRPLMAKAQPLTLQARAKKAAANAQSKMRVYYNVTTEIYAVIVDLAEEFADTPMNVARRAMVDGLRQFRDFRTPYDYDNPMEGSARTHFRPVESGRPPRRGVLERTPALLHGREERDVEQETLGREDAEDADVKNFVSAVEDRSLLRGFLPASPGAPRKPEKVPIDYGDTEKPLPSFNANPRVTDEADD